MSFKVISYLCQLLFCSWQTQTLQDRFLYHCSPQLLAQLFQSLILHLDPAKTNADELLGISGGDFLVQHDKIMSGKRKHGAATAASQLVFTDCFHSICRAALESLGQKLRVDTAACPMLARTLQTAIMSLKHKIYFITCLLWNLAQMLCNLNAQTYDQNGS